MSVGVDPVEKRTRLRMPRRPRGEASTGRARPAYTHLAVTGLVLIGLAPALMLLTSFVGGMDLEGDLGFFAIASVVPLLGAALVWRYGTWGKVAGILVALIAAAGLFWTAFGLAFPASFADFTPGVMVPLGVLAGVGGSIAAIVAQRRGNLGTEIGRGERRMITAVVGIVAAAALVSGVWNLVARDTVAGDEDAVTSTMADFAFVEGTYTVPAGEATSFVVHNGDPFVHDFTIPELGVEPVTVVPGGEQLIEISGAEPGTYTIYCTLHSDTSHPEGGEEADEPMAATLIVE